MNRDSGRDARDSTGPAGPVPFLVAALLVAFAPIVRGGNRPLALLVMESAALLGLAVLALSRPRGALDAIPQLWWWGVAILVAAPLAQLVPVPGALWAQLPGHGPYASALEIAGADALAAWRPLSIDPAATEYAWLAAIPCFAIFVLVQFLDRRSLRRLVAWFLIVAVCEAILGIMQLGAPASSLLHLGNPYGAGVATGTYVNKNHFAALMAMALPVLMALWAAEVLPPKNAKGEILRDHPRNRDVKLARRILLSILVMAVCLALLFTRSRAGIGTGFAVLALASIALVWNAGSVHARVVLAIVALSALALAAYIGLTRVLESFSPEQLALGYEGRMRILSGTLTGALEFLPFGSGLGTFADVFPRYQLQGFAGYVDHAHNDSAEAFLELGVAGVAAIAFLALAYAARMRSLLRSHLSRSLGYPQLGAGLGMLAMAAHGLFDFNFHIPANALYFSFLAGVFFFTPAEGRA
ncbi:MAG: O-antigen ligase family protein [Usitatibacter sp.]